MHHKKRIMERMVLIALPKVPIVTRTTKQNCEVFLDALFQSGEYGAKSDAVLIVTGLPGMGGLRDDEFYNDLVWQLSQQGFASLRFFYRGYGASGGERSEEMSHFVADVKAAYGQLQESVSGKVSIVAYGFGCDIIAQLVFDDSQQFYIAPHLGLSLPQNSLNIGQESTSETIKTIGSQKTIKSYCYYDAEIYERKELERKLGHIDWVQWYQEAGSGYIALVTDIVQRVVKTEERFEELFDDSNFSTQIQEFDFGDDALDDVLELDI